MSAENEKYWNIIATRYDTIVDRAIGDRLRPLVRERLEGEKSPGKVVELGCGTGYFTRILASIAKSVVATDISDEMLARAREGLKGYRNVYVQKEDCLATSFADGSFDTAFMALVINVTDNPMQALCEANRILRPGGVLIIANPDGSRIDIADIPGTMVRFNAGYGFAAEHFSKEEFESLEKSSRAISDNDLSQLLPAAGFHITALEILRDDSDKSNLTMDYVRAIKTSNISGSAARALNNYEKAETVITVKNLGKNYGKFVAVLGVSFTVRKGEVFALLGPNGAGKTTVVEILELLKAPTRGLISILGSDVLYGAPVGNLFMAQDQNYGALKERIGVLPQSFNSFELLTVYENIDYFARMYSKHIDVDKLIREMGLKEKRNALFKDLSGGLKQRVGITIALVNDPDIVFLDEPTTGLDPRSRRDVWDAIKLLKARGKTIFLTTHYMDEAYQLADRVCIIHKGSVAAEGSPEDLINQYGGGNTLVVRECDTGALSSLLKAIPGSVVDGNSVLAKLQEDDGIESIAKAVEVIKAGGFTCKEIYVKKPTLDDVFLNVTGESLTEGGA
jgi:ABC-2 type transport system ATP-binding protein